MTNEPKKELAEFAPRFDEDNDPLADLQALGDWIQATDCLIRLGEFAPYGKVMVKGKTYSVRVNGGESEAPHVHVRCGDIEVRLFLGSSPREVRPVQPDYNKVLKNKQARIQVLTYVQTHHGCLLEAWIEMGNTLHSNALDHLTVECEEHKRPPIELMGVNSGDLNGAFDRTS